MQQRFWMTFNLERTGPTIRAWEEHLTWQLCFPLCPGAQQTFVIDREVELFTWVPWLEFKALIPLGVQRISTRHFFCLHLCPPLMMRVMSHFTNNIRLVAREVIHVLQILRLYD